ncbi:unnamed protein product [Rotaria sordida]|uniref:Endonuclease/exonuclease/phosphatase domain-containing protein n=1 Tax=Rotaria sordida TaxID=392033 RepID=A0A815J671_9BILA|nr:unnamed protein product [Rotaria sordida]
MATKRQVSNSEDENDLHSLTTQNEDICLIKLNQNDQTPGGTKRRKKNVSGVHESSSQRSLIFIGKERTQKENSLGDVERQNKLNQQAKQNDEINVNCYDQEISLHALHYAVEQQLPPIKINRDPKINNHSQGVLLIKQLFLHIEKDFRQGNKMYKHSLGFEYWFVDKQGNLVCYTREPELYVYLCDIAHYPSLLLSINISPEIPKHLPPQYSVLLKPVSNSISYNDILDDIKSIYPSLFKLEEMNGTRKEQSRHIRMDLKDKHQYDKIINEGVLTIHGQLIEVLDEIKKTNSECERLKMEMEKKDAEVKEKLEQQNRHFQQILVVATQLIHQQANMLEQFTKAVNETLSVVQQVINNNDGLKNGGQKEVISSLINTCQSLIHHFNTSHQQQNLQNIQILPLIMNNRLEEVCMSQNMVIHNEIQLTPNPILLGVVYIPPGSLSPFHLFTQCFNKPVFIFGDFNAKHISWNCMSNNVSGNHLVSWLEQTGNEMIFPSKPTSRRSDAVIDFGITHDANGWNCETLDEGTSDHYPVFFQSPYSFSTKDLFLAARASYLQERNKLRLEWMREGQNIWKFAQPHFHTYTPAFRGLSLSTGKERDPQIVVNTLGDFYDTHFSEPNFDPSNACHRRYLAVYTQIAYTPNIPLEQITYEDVIKEWKKFLPKKATDKLEERARIVLKQLEEFAENTILPINIAKTKAILVHNVVVPKYPKLAYKSQPIEYVRKFKYLGIIITTKLGWGLYISEKMKNVRKVYNGMKILFHRIPKKDIKMRRKIFLAYALPHLLWIFCIWFFLTEKQKEQIEHVYCSGLRLVYSLQGWDDFTTLTLS